MDREKRQLRKLKRDIKQAGNKKRRQTRGNYLLRIGQRKIAAHEQQNSDRRKVPELARRESNLAAAQRTVGKHNDAGNQEAAGWVFFNTDNKWLGHWKTQEEFVLRLPLDGKIFEFPFKLPPKAGDLVLRKRE